MEASLLHKSCDCLLFLSHFFLLHIDLVYSVTKLYTKFLGDSPPPQFFIKLYFLLDTWFVNNQIEVNQKFSTRLHFFYMLDVILISRCNDLLNYGDFCLPCGGTHLNHSQTLALQSGDFVVFVPNDDGWIAPKIGHSCTIPLFFNNMYVTLRSSTCFEQHSAHPQEDKLYHHSLWCRHTL